jgi:hypothetical protein
MASPNTLQLRKIGTVNKSVFVKQPHLSKTIRQQRDVPVYQLGKVIHSGGTRVGSFK